MAKASEMIKIIDAGLSDIVNLLKCGEIACLPTDTLFTLTCDATNNEALNNIFRIKSRDRAKHLPILCSSLEQAMQYGIFSEMALLLAKKFWPGKLTLILPTHGGKGKDSIAIRVPNHGSLLAIMQKLDGPIIGTSANISGNDDQYNIDEIMTQLRTGWLNRQHGQGGRAIRGPGADEHSDEENNTAIQKHNITLYYCSELGQSVEKTQPSTIVDTRHGRALVVRHGYISENDIYDTNNASFNF